MDLSEVVSKLAAKHGVGAVALAGVHALGTARPFDPIEILVTVPLETATDFAEALGESCECAVHLFDPWVLPHSHPLHFSARWLNAVRLPSIPIPRGSILRELSGRPANMPLKDVSHFVEADTPRRPQGRPYLIVSAPPIGGFLL